MPRIEHPLEVRRVSPAGRHFLFGYYDRVAVSAGGRWHLALNPSFMDRPNTGGDAASLGVIDLRDGAWKVLDESPAWNWQMGSCAQWIGPDPAKTFIHNAREGGRAFARLRHVEEGVLREFNRPVYDASFDRRFGLSVNFARMHVCRPGYGYPDIEDPFAGQNAPDGDGLWHVDFATGRSELIASLAEVSGVDTPPGARDGLNWFNHVMISPGGTRVMFLHRWLEGGQWRRTRLFTCRPDGSELELLNPGPKVSHCDWLGEERILSWCQFGGEEMHYYLMNVDGSGAEAVGEKLFDGDGHCSFRPGDGRWMLTDSYPGREEERGLVLFDRETGTRYDLGRFRSPRAAQKPADIRCDLHPRWDASGRTISFDSIHEGHRGIYSVDVSELIP